MAELADIWEDELRLATEFTVTEDHLKLLRAAWVEWEDAETGAPGIDPKKPYGNGDVLHDILEILRPDEAAVLDDEGELLPDTEERLMRLHAETALALQVALSTGEFMAGRYRKKERHGKDWEMVTPA